MMPETVCFGDQYHLLLISDIFFFLKIYSSYRIFIKPGFIIHVQLFQMIQNTN